MAVVTVGAAGDYTTWVAAETNSNASDTVQGIDNAEFAESIIISGADNRTFTVASGVRHDGTLGSGCRIRGTSGHTIEVVDDGITIEYLEIELDHTGSSSEGIRCSQTTGESGTVQYSIIHANQQTTQQDGIYSGSLNGSRTLSVIACWIKGFNRAGIHIQDFSDNSTLTANIDSCLIVDCGHEAPGGGIASNYNNAINVYNTACLDNTSSGDDYDDENTAATWSGSNNIASDTSAESRFTGSFDSVNLTDSTAASGEVYLVTDETLTAPDWNLLDTGSGTRVAVGGGTDRNPPITQDMVGYSLDATGPDDIGPLQIQAAAANQSDLPKGTMNLAGIVPQAAATENRFSNSAKGTMNLTGIAPTVESTVINITSVDGDDTVLDGQQNVTVSGVGFVP